MVQHWNRHTTRFYPWPVVIFNLYKTAFRVPYQLFSHSQQNMSIFEIMKHIVLYYFFDLNLMWNHIIQSEKEKNQYFRRYEDFFNMYYKTFIQHKMKIIRNLITHSMIWLVLCCKYQNDIGRTRNNTLENIQRRFGNYIKLFYFK